MPSRLDAALLLATSLKLWDSGDTATASALVSEAVNLTPGHEDVIALEEAVGGGTRPELELLEFVVAARGGDSTATGAEDATSDVARSSDN